MGLNVFVLALQSLLVLLISILELRGVSPVSETHLQTFVPKLLVKIPK